MGVTSFNTVKGGSAFLVGEKSRRDDGEALG